MSARVIASAAVALVVLAALWLLDARWPAPEDLQQDDFAWTHERGEARRIPEARCLELPQPFGDCDLLATVELPEGGELDVVLRRVEPRPRRVAAAGQPVTEEVVPFHGRFSVLRLSATTAGPAWRSRDEALFGDDLRGGVLVKAGVPASIQVALRGRRLRANVAGHVLPLHEAQDDHGGLALVARGGPGLLRYLKILHAPRARPWSWWLLASLLAGGLAWLALRGKAAAGRAVLAALGAAAAGALAADALVFGWLLPWTRPDPLSCLLAILAPLPLALTLAGRPRRRTLLAVALALLWLACLEAAARRERTRLEPLEDPRLASHFGPDSGPAPFDALARRLSSQSAVHTLEGPATRVLLLGGRALFEASPDLAEQLGLRTALALRQALGREVEGIVVPTPLGYAAQQVRLWSRFYRALTASAVVLGISRFEPLAEDREPLPRRGPCTLLELWRAPAADEAGRPERLERTLAELAAGCGELRVPLVLATEAGLDAPWLAAVERFAAAHRVPLVRDVLDGDGRPRFDALAAALLPLLR